jgi:hypothetical protein
VHRNSDYLRNRLIPAFAAVPLERLTHEHVNDFVQREFAADGGLVTLRRYISVLSSALNDARRNHRPPRNADRFAKIPDRHGSGSPAGAPTRPARSCGTARSSRIPWRSCSNK